MTAPNQIRDEITCSNRSRRHALRLVVLLPLLCANKVAAQPAEAHGPDGSTWTVELGLIRGTLLAGLQAEFGRNLRIAPELLVSAGAGLGSLSVLYASPISRDAPVAWYTGLGVGVFAGGLLVGPIGSGRLGLDMPLGATRFGIRFELRGFLGAGEGAGGIMAGIRFR